MRQSIVDGDNIGEAVIAGLRAAITNYKLGVDGELHQRCPRLMAISEKFHARFI